MNGKNLLEPQRQYLAGLLEAIQRCVYFLDASDRSVTWPLTATMLTSRKKDTDLFEALAAVNERFSKLQDTLGAAIDEWQIARTARNLAAHDYEVDYKAVAEHFNTLHDLKAGLNATAGRFVVYCESQLSAGPQSPDFASEFLAIVSRD